MAAIEFDAKVNAAELNKLLNDLRSGAEGASKAINDALGGSVTKKLVLETITDENGARKLVAVEKERLTVTDQITRAQQKLNDVSRDSVTSLRQQVNEAKQARDQIAKYQTAIDGVGRSVSVLNGRWAAQNAKVQDLQAQLTRVDGSPFWKRLQSDLGAGGFISFVNGLTAITQGFQSASIVIGQITGSVNELIDAVAKLQTFSLAFEAIGAGASGAQQALNESSRIALNLGVSLATTRTGFQQLTPVIRNSGGSIADVSSIIEALSSRFAAFGISGDRARRVTNGIIQAFGKGKLQAEELTQQIAEADPAFGTDFAKALGISTAELLKLVKAGEITSDVLIKTIPLLSKSSLLYGNLGSSATDAANNLISGTGKIPVTIDQVRAKIDSLNQLSLEALAKSLQPFLFSLIRGQAVVSDFLSQLSRSAAVESLGRVLGGIGNSIGLIFQALATAATPIISIVSAIASIANALLRIPGISEAVGIAILSKLVAPLAVFRTGLASTVNRISPLGQSITKVSALYNDFNKKIVTAATAFDPFGQSVTRTVALYKLLGQSVSDTSRSVKGAASIASNSTSNYERQAKGLASLAASTTFAASKADQYKARIVQLNGELQRLEQKKGPKAVEGQRKGGGDITGGGVLAGQISTVQRELKSANTEFARWNAVVEKSSNLSARVAGQIAASGNAINRASGSVRGAGEEYVRLTNSLAQVTQVNNSTTQALKQARGQLTALKERTLSLNQALAQGKISFAQYAPEFGKLSAQSARLKADIGALGAILDDTGRRGDAYRGQLAAISAQTQTTGGRFAGLRGAIGGLGSALSGALAGGFQAAKGALVGLAAALGPLGVALIAIGVLQAAYASATADAKEQTDRAATSAKAYSEITKRLGGADLKPADPTPLQRGWRDFSVGVATAVNVVIDSFNELSTIVQNNGKKIQESLKDAPPLVTALGLALRDGLRPFGGEDALRVLGLVGDEAKDGTGELRQFALTARTAFAGFKTDASNISQTADALRKFAASTEGATLEGKLTINTEYKALKEQVDQSGEAVAKFKNEYKALEAEYASTGSAEAKENLDKIGASLSEAENRFEGAKQELVKLGVALGLIKPDSTDVLADSLSGLEASLKSAREGLSNAAPGSREFKAAATNVAILEKELEDLQRKASNPVTIRAGIDEKQIQNLNKRVELLAKLDKENKKPKERQDAGNIRQILKDIAQVDREIKELEDFRIKVDASSIQNINKEIKAVEDEIIELDVRSPELPGAIASLISLKKRAEDIKDAQARITIELLQKGIASGEIPTSLNNIGELIKELEGRVARLSVDSPELPGVIANLEKTKGQLDSLNGRVATFTVRAIEEQLAAGGPRTQEVLGRRTTAQQQVVRTTATSAPNYDQEIQALRRFEEEQKASALSTQELKNKLAQNQRDTINENSQLQLDRLKTEKDAVISRYEEEKTRIKEASEVAKEASDKRIRAIRSEIDAIKETTDARIAALESAGPAEQRLAALRREELQQRARGGGREGLEAQAELERLDRAERIAEIKKQSAEEEKRLQQQIKAEEEEQRKRDEEAKAKERELEAKIREEKKQIQAAEEAHQQKMQEARAKELEEKQKLRDVETAAIQAELEARGKLQEAQAELARETERAANSVSNTLVPSLDEAVGKVNLIATAFKNLNGQTVRVNLQQVTSVGRWTGGPVDAGQQYKVNELGQEGFLSSSGQLKPINRPSNALWTAPSSGTVIPAHVWKELDVPSQGVNVRRTQAPVKGDGPVSQIAKIARQIGINLASSQAAQNTEELAAVQAQQAIEIGKLSHAVDKLANKKWNVQVGVTSPGNSSYLNALSHRL